MIEQWRHGTGEKRNIKTKYSQRCKVLPIHKPNFFSSVFRPTHVTFPMSRPTYSFPAAASTGACFLSQSGTVVTLTPVSSTIVG